MNRKNYNNNNNKKSSHLCSFHTPKFPHHTHLDREWKHFLEFDIRFWSVKALKPCLEQCVPGVCFVCLCLVNSHTKWYIICTAGNWTMKITGEGSCSHANTTGDASLNITTRLCIVAFQTYENTWLRLWLWIKLFPPAKSEMRTVSIWTQSHVWRLLCRQSRRCKIRLCRCVQ